MQSQDKFNGALNNLNATIDAWKKLAEVDPKKELHVDSQDRISTSWMGRVFTKAGQSTLLTDQKTKELWALRMESTTRSQVLEMGVALQNTSNLSDYKAAYKALEELEKNLPNIKRFRGADPKIDEAESERFVNLTEEIKEGKKAALSKIYSTSSLILAEKTSSAEVKSSAIGKAEVEKMLNGETVNQKPDDLSPEVSVPHQFNIDSNRLKSLTFQGKPLAIPSADTDQAAKIQIYTQIKQALGNDETSTQRVLGLLTQAHAATFNERGLKIYNPDAKSVNGMPPEYKVWIGASGLHLAVDIEKSSVFITVRTRMFPKIADDLYPETRKSVLLMRVVEIPLKELADPKKTSFEGMRVTDANSVFLPHEVAEDIVKGG